MESGLASRACDTEAATRTRGPSKASAACGVRFHTVTSAPEAASVSTNARPIAPVPITDTLLISVPPDRQGHLSRHPDPTNAPAGEVVAAGQPVFDPAPLEERPELLLSVAFGRV